jgi:hypothetical protein
MTGEQVMRILTRGADVDYDELTRRTPSGEGRGVAVQGPIGAGVAR